jgi:hypothetical protein
MSSAKYTDGQIERALKALVLADGNIKLAQRRLDSDGLHIPERTLREWRTTHSARIAALTEQRHWVAQGLAEDYESIASEITSMAHKMLGEMDKRDDWQDMNIASLGKSLQSLITSGAIATDKAQLLRGLPTAITESRDLSSLLKLLDSPKFKGVVAVNQDLIDSTATEVTEQPAITEESE